MNEAERLAEILEQTDQMHENADISSKETAAELRRLSAINAELVEIAKSVEGIISNCDISSGICCCGDSMEGHPDPMNCGHTPVDSGWYAADSLFQKTKEALEKAKQ